MDIQQSGLKQPQLVVAKLNDTNLCAAVRLVSAFKPFSHYSFGLMVNKLTDQLSHAANLMVVEGSRVMAYAGWIVVDEVQAEQWKKEGGDPPMPDWTGGRAVIVTIVVSVNARYLPLLIRGVSHVCAGKKVYRMRSFQDGRPDMRRPPITGRKHRFG